MRTAIIVIWLIVAGIDGVIATVATLNFWKSRHKAGMKYIIYGLLGSIFYDVIITVLAISAFMRTGNNNVVSFDLMLFTLGNIVKILPTTAFSAYMVGIIKNGKETS